MARHVRLLFVTERVIILTGKELILYILQNNLEDSNCFTSDLFMSDLEAAVKFGVGVETIRIWAALNIIKNIRVGKHVFIFKDAVDPRKEKEQCTR